MIRRIVEEEASNAIRTVAPHIKGTLAETLFVDSFGKKIVDRIKREIG